MSPGVTLGTEQPSLRKSPTAPSERRARASPAQRQLRAGPGMGTESPPRTGARSRDSQTGSRGTGKGLGQPRAARPPTGGAPGTRPTGPARDRPSSRAAHGEPCPRRRPRSRAGTPGTARPGHPSPPRPGRGRSPAPHGGTRTAPVQPSPEQPTATTLAPFRPPQLRSPDRSPPRSPPARSSGPVPAHQSDPRPVPPAYRRSPSLPHARCSLTRLHSPSLAVPAAPPRSPSLPVPGAPAPLTAAPRRSPCPVPRTPSQSLPAQPPVPQPRSPSLSAARPLLPEQKASSAPRTAPPATGPAPALTLRYWLPRTPINPWARRAPPPPEVFIRSPLAGARPPRPAPAADWTAGRGARGAAAGEEGRDHEGTTWVTSVGVARWGWGGAGTRPWAGPGARGPPGGAGTPGPCGDPRGWSAGAAGRGVREGLGAAGAASPRSPPDRSSRVLPPRSRRSRRHPVPESSIGYVPAHLGTPRCGE